MSFPIRNYPLIAKIKREMAKTSFMLFLEIFKSDFIIINEVNGRNNYININLNKIYFYKKCYAKNIKIRIL